MYQPPQNSGPYWQPGQFPNGTPSLPPPKLTVAQRFKGLPKNTQFGLGCGTLILVLALCICSVAVGSAGSKSTSLASTTVTVVPTKQPTIQPTMHPTSIPTLKPTPPTPVPQATQPPTPTQPPAPTQPPVPTQSPAPQPTQPPTGVNGNPWGYDFTIGNVIYAPPDTFCSYFDCIASFWKGKGYVDECIDSTYSKSGGLNGACSKHGGEMRPLYSH